MKTFFTTLGLLIIFVLLSIGIVVLSDKLNKNKDSQIKEKGTIHISADDTNWVYIKTQLVMQLLNKSKTLEYGYKDVDYYNSGHAVKTPFIDFKAKTNYKTKESTDCRVYYQSYYYLMTCDNIKSASGAYSSAEAFLDYDLDSCRLKSKNGSCSGWFYTIK